MKRFPSGLPLILAAALCLSACAAQSPPVGPEQSPTVEPEQSPTLETVTPVVPPEETEPYVFTRENLPRLDGSTSTAPLAQAMCALLLGEDLDAVADLIRFSRTTQSYRNLMAGSADLLLAAEPSPEVLSELEAGGEWLLTPFATDALVFVVNENNPVDGLTTEQVQQIYTGQITNWSQVGGDDLDIVPFQRNAEAGSQTMFEKLVMAGQPLMDPPLQWTGDSMSGLLEAVREYDNSPCAIGYTVYYYANDMEMAKGLKVLSIDGVAPSAEAIRAGDYPFLNPYFVAIAKDAPEDSSTRALYNWILGPEGQALAAREGYVPVLDLMTEQPPSDLHPDVDGGRWYPHAVEDLIPSKDYGPLYPYVGTTVTNLQYWIDESGREQLWDTLWATPVYGLMTREGKLVTDPAYQSVILPVSHYGGEATPYPVLLLYRSDPGWESFSNGQRFAVCARDGSWCTDHEFWTYAMKDNYLLLLGVNGITLLDCDSGMRTDWSWTKLGISETELPGLVEYIMYGMGFTWTDRGACLGLTDPDDWENSQRIIFDPVTGELFTLSHWDWNVIEAEGQQYYWDSTRDWTESWDLENVYIQRGEENYSFPIPKELDIIHNIDVRGDLAILTDYSGIESRCWLYRLSTGALLEKTSFISFLYDTVAPASPAFVRVEDLRESQTLYTPDFEPFLFYDDSNVYFSYQDGLITARDDMTFFGCYNAQTGECIFYRNLGFDD